MAIDEESISAFTTAMQPKKRLRQSFLSDNCELYTFT
jgi:hypothetical protein